MVRRTLVSTALVVLLLSSCGKDKAPQTDGSNMPQTGMIQDLITYPQDVFVYADVLPAKPILSEDRAKDLYDEYRRNFFCAWKNDNSRIPLKDAYHIFFEDSELTGMRVLENPLSKTFKQGPPCSIWWAENLLLWDRKNWDELLINANKETYPSRFDKAIIVERVLMRLAPTNRPTFRDPKLAGEGFPFDYLSLANIHIGAPVIVLHTSKDGAWAYIETGVIAGLKEEKVVFLSGWVPERAVALVTPKIIDQAVKAPQVAITRDNTPLKNNGGVLGLGFLGTVLPLAKEKESSFVVLTPVRDNKGAAKMERVEVSKDDAVLMPAVLTAKKMASIANPLVNQPYGWGGAFGRRDCSEFVKDLFIPFGVWLPRNSGVQVRSWNFTPVEDPAESTVNALLKEKGIPFATFIGFKGHIGLYLGMYNDAPVMLHDVWGVRTEEDGVEGRHILGRVVITSLEPGAEISSVTRGWLLKKMVGISTLP